LAAPTGTCKIDLVLTDSLLLEVSEAKSKQLDQWQRGIQLHADTGLPLADLRMRVVTDRWSLASNCLSRGEKMLRARPPLYRDAISRFYYAMYHGFRAAAYLEHGGDDFEEHKTLPTKLPMSFFDVELWSNNLKLARDTRNRADYEPYPEANADWQTEARALRAQAADVLPRIRAFLEARGCDFP
jgi:uncharacterized protein (UPF0332 family)